MFVFFNASRRTSSTDKMLSACLAVALGITCSRVATAQNWSGATDSNYGVGSNWVGNAVPSGTAAIATIVAASNNPLLSSGSYSNRQLNINYGGNFTMSDGALSLSTGTSNTLFLLGADNATGISRFTMNGGNLQVAGQFISTNGRSGNNSVAYYTQSGGTVFINTSGTVDAPNSLRMSVAGSNVGYRTYINITGGTTVSSGAVTMGQSSSSGNAAFVTGTISGGALMATRFAAAAFPNDVTLDDQGTLRFSGGGFKLSGGQMVGSDCSARDGFRQGTTNSANIAPLIASGTVGIEYAGGMMQIYTDRTEGSVYSVQTSAPDPSTAYTETVQNRGVKRGLIDVGPNTGAAWTSLPDTAIKANVSTGVSPVRLDGLVTNVATIAGYDVADYNTDGIVDQGDYVYWQSQNGLTYSGALPVDWATVAANDLPYWAADGNGDSKVDSVDLTVWQNRVGQRRTDGAFQFAKDQTINVASGTASQSDSGFTVGSAVGNLNLTVFSPMNTKSFTKTGGGEFVLTGSNTWTYPTNVSAGTLRVSGSQAFVCYSSTTTVQAGATLKVDAGANVISPRVAVDGTLDGTGATITVDANSGIRALAIGASGNVTGSPAVVVSNTGSVTLSSATPVVVSVATLSVAEASSGKVDLGRGLVNIASGSAVDLVADIIAGRGDGSWNGTGGITSSAAASELSRAVGWVDNGGGSLTVAYAAPGDTNVDWIVDVVDASNFVAAGKYGTGEPATWAEGDFNYDGVCDSLDAADFASAGLYGGPSYNTAPGSVGSVAAVPEPSGCVAVGVVGLILAWRSRRRIRA